MFHGGGAVKGSTRREAVSLRLLATCMLRFMQACRLSDLKSSPGIRTRQVHRAHGELDLRRTRMLLLLRKWIWEGLGRMRREERGEMWME